MYYVRSVGDGGIQSGRGAADYATTATALFARTVAVNVSIDATDMVELRKGVDAVRAAAGLSAAFSGGPSSGQLIYATDFTNLIAALDQARALFGKAPFAYSGVLTPASRGPVLAEHIVQLRDALR